MTRPLPRLERPESYRLDTPEGSVPGTVPPDGARAVLDSVRDLHSLLDDAPAAETPPLIAVSSAMQGVLEQGRRVARSKVSVLLEGESGTGKELVARLIHAASPRRRGPFVRVNCAALAEGLVESELFGHERGAFTGADAPRPGRFELAHGGTLLLDEVSEMSVRLQAKLLRVLEHEEFERVGGARTLRADVRAVATSNRDLPREMDRGTFRRDLYYRLSGVVLRLPPLRARRDDIAPLALHFLEQYRHEGAGPLSGISARGLELLTAHDWPGNVRQLRNVIHRACILAQGPELGPGDFPLFDASPGGEAARGQTLAEIERHAILDALREAGGNKTAAARRLGVTARTLLNKLKKYRREQTAGGDH